MIKIATILLSISILSTSPSPNLIDNIRTSYNKLDSDKMLCERMMIEFEKTKDDSTINLGYLGALQVIWAKHVFNPITKLNTFKEGKKNIELAIEKDPNNVELRFIRLSIQLNTPLFLFYNANLKEDAEFLQKNRNRVTSSSLSENISLILDK